MGWGGVGWGGVGWGGVGWGGVGWGGVGWGGVGWGGVGWGGFGGFRGGGLGGGVVKALVGGLDVHRVEGFGGARWWRGFGGGLARRLSSTKEPQKSEWVEIRDVHWKLALSLHQSRWELCPQPFRNVFPEQIMEVDGLSTSFDQVPQN